jgi:hypothetical protein
MATNYSGRFSKPLGGNRHAFGGAGLNLDLGALSGQTDIATVFDDMNHNIATVAYTALPLAGSISDFGWVTTLVGAGGGTVGVGTLLNSTLDANYLVPDEGANMQLQPVVGVGGIGAAAFPHYRFRSSTTSLDHNVYVFACRVGYQSSGTSQAKLYLGWAEGGDVDIMDPATGVLSTAAGAGQAGPLLGFHINLDPAVTPNISLVSQRVHGVAFVEGTNFTAMRSGADVPVDPASGQATGEVIWHDLALLCHGIDNSDNTNNGSVTGFFRRVPTISDDFGSTIITDPVAAGLRETSASDGDSPDSGRWVKHPTVLLNQIPTMGGAIGSLVPTIEVIAGPATNGSFLIDWWAFGVSRPSLRASLA